MKLGPITKIDKRNKQRQKFDNDVILANCDVTVLFLIYGQSGSRIPDAWPARLNLSLTILQELKTELKYL